MWVSCGQQSFESICPWYEIAATNRERQPGWYTQEVFGSDVAASNVAMRSCLTSTENNNLIHTPESQCDKNVHKYLLKEAYLL